MAATNGFFGNLQGPFSANIELFQLIQAECKDQINYLSKIGIHYVGGFNLDLKGNYFPQIFILINDTKNQLEKTFQLGKTRVLELEDVEITSIKFMQDVDDNVYIDYQYEKV